MLTMMVIFPDSLKWLTTPSSLVVRPTREGAAAALRHLSEPATVKDLVESLGIPHCEIGSVFSLESMSSPGCRESDAIPLDRMVRRGDILEVREARPRALDPARFVCDVHLGKLAILLRVMGFDTLWRPDWTEAEIARRGLNEDRTVLSRSRSLLKRRTMDNALLIRSDRADEQAAEVLRRFLLADRIDMFGRCSRCNGRLQNVAKASVADRIPPKTAKWLDTYYTCADCGHLFWRGTHVTALEKRVAAIVALGSPEPRTDGP